MNLIDGEAAAVGNTGPWNRLPLSFTLPSDQNER